MDYRIDFSVIDDMDVTIQRQVMYWNRFLEEAGQRVDELIATQDFTGNTADRLKEYLGTVHKLLLMNMTNLVASFAGEWNSYKASIQSLDQSAGVSLNTVLDTETMDHIIKGLTLHKSSADEIMRCVTRQLLDVSDIMGSCSFCHCNELDTGIEYCIGLLNSFKSAIEQVESSYSSRISLLEDSISADTGTVQNALAQDSIYRKSFTASAYSTSETFAALYSSTVALKQNNNYRQGEYQQAIEVNANREKALQAEAERIRLEEERKEREKKVGLFKGLVGGLCVVFEATVTVFTGGTGTSFAKSITGGIKGLANYVIDDIYVDQKDFNLFECGKEVVGGTIKGYVGSYISDAFGVLSAESTNPLGKAIWTGTEYVVSGGADRFLSGCLEGDDYGTVFKNTFDVKEISKDVVGGAVEDLTKGSVSGLVDKLTPCIPHGKGNFDYNRIFNKGSTNIVEGMATRTVDEYFENRYTGKDMDFEKVFNPYDVLGDFVLGGSKEIGDEIVTNGEIGTRPRTEVTSIFNPKTDTFVSSGLEQDGRLGGPSITGDTDAKMVHDVEHKAVEDVSDRTSKKESFDKNYPDWLGGSKT